MSRIVYLNPLLEARNLNFYKPLSMKKFYDVFNGDADGLCSLQQLRLATAKKSTLITGLKRDIALLSQCVADKNTEITVLDVSLDKNKQALLKVLDAGAKVFYADHHFTGEVPKHDNFEAYLDLSADTCTALIINKYLKNRFPLWAIVGAFGDNQYEAAEKLAKKENVKAIDLVKLKQLGICLNYNGYGFTLDDLIFHPADLFDALHPYKSPLEFIDNNASFNQLLTAYNQDINLANQQQPLDENAQGALYCLENKKWARRVNGVFANNLARQNANKAHAVLVACNNKTTKGYRVSVRAPLNNKKGADDLCRQFATGGGRKAAAGINFLPDSELATFKVAFFEQFNAQ